MRPHAIYMMVLEATYNEEFLAERTEITMKALLECAARTIFVSSNAIVRGDGAAFEPLPEFHVSV
jgi:hypothetical protein